MIINIAYGVAALVGVGIIFIGSRFLWAPHAAAAGFGIPHNPAETPFAGWLAVKAVRDMASGVILLIFLANGAPHLLGQLMLAASLMPIGDAVIVLRTGGTKATAYGIHGATAAAMLVAGACLLAA